MQDRKRLEICWDKETEKHRICWFVFGGRFPAFQDTCPSAGKNRGQECQRPGHRAWSCREQMETPRAEDVPRICSHPPPHWHARASSNFPLPGSRSVPAQEVLIYSWDPPAATQVPGPAVAPGPALNLEGARAGSWPGNKGRARWRHFGLHVSSRHSRGCHQSRGQSPQVLPLLPTCLLSVRTAGPLHVLFPRLGTLSLIPTWPPQIPLS